MPLSLYKLIQPLFEYYVQSLYLDLETWKRFRKEKPKSFGDSTNKVLNENMIEIYTIMHVLEIVAGRESSP